jgi:TolA-binding protein
MKKLVTILLVMAMVIVSANFALAGKSDKAAEVVADAKESVIDYMTPMNVLVSEYYKIVAQIKQFENQIEGLETQLERLDAVIRYQQGIEQRIKTEEK